MGAKFITFETHIEIEEAVWAPTIPLLVMEQCDPIEQAVWLALRWLRAAFPKRKGFGTREIAQRAKVHRNTVPAQLASLEAKALIRRIGEERAGFKKPRIVYDIPLDAIATKSSDMVRDVVARWRVQYEPPPPPPPAQLHLAGLHGTPDVHGGTDLVSRPDAESGGLHGTRDVHGHAHLEGTGIFEVIPENAHGTPDVHGGTDLVSRPDAESGGLHGTRDVHGHAHLEGMGSPPDVHAGPTHGWDREDLRMDGYSAPPAKSARPGRPPAIPPAPPAEVYAQHPHWAIGGPLPSHPRDLWRNACAAPTAAHDDKLAALAAEHDASTEGYGWYWVGRAILAGTDAHEQITSPTYIRNTLIRWRDEDSYGSDRARPAKEHIYERPRPVGSRPRRAAVPTAQLIPPDRAGPAEPDDISDEELQRIEDEAGERFRRYLDERESRP